MQVSPYSKWLSVVCVGAVSGTVVYFVIHKTISKCNEVNDDDKKSSLVRRTVHRHTKRCFS